MTTREPPTVRHKIKLNKYLSSLTQAIPRREDLVPHVTVLDI